MDLTCYGESFEKLHQKQQEYLKLADKRVITVLNKMLKEALLTSDQQLIGYVYHSIAFAEHFIMGRYNRFLKNLRLAARYLLSSSDQSEMMHVCYLIAIDSMNKGLNDIAVLYFREARSIAEETGQETSAAILDESIGHILMNIGRYKEARKYLKRSLAVIKKDKKHPHYFSNLTSNYMNDSMACLELNKYEEARRSFGKVKGFIEKHPNEFKIGTRIHFELLRLRLALIDDDSREASASYSELLSLLHSDSTAHMYMVEIKKLCDVLIEKRDYERVEELINTVEENGVAPDAADALRVLTLIKIDYYRAVGNADKLKESYKMQDEIHALAQAGRKSLSIYTGGLIRLTTDLRKERDQILARQEMLINMTEIDPLTKLSNRYGANLKLDEAFERSYRDKTGLGIVYIDVDGLKEINDSRGHLEGDRYLVSLADVLRSQSEKEGYFASRFGGDEFVLIFEGKEDKDIEECIEAVREKSGVRFSAGIYNEVPRGRQKSWDFLEFADMELYKEKKNKKRER